MAEYFAGGHLRFVNGEWRDDDGNAIEISRVRHGRWIKESDGGTRCRVCNKQVRDVTGGGDEPVDLSDMPYCPKCGAKMDGGADNG